MKHKMLIAVVIVLWVTGCSNASKDLRTYTDEEWIEDITVLTEAIESKHPNPFNTISKEAWDAEIELLIKEVKNLSDRDISFRLQQLVAKVKDAHTAYYGKEMKLGEQIFPFLMHWYGEELRVNETISDYEALIGAKLISVNNMPLCSIIEKLNTISSYENNQWAKVNSSENISDYNILNFLEIVKNNEATFEFELVSGEVVSQKVSAMNDSNYEEAVKVLLNENLTEDLLPLKNKVPSFANPNMWFTYIHEEELLYFQYNEAVPDTDALLTQLSEGIQSVIKENESSFATLVIDLRHNTGGDSRGFSKFAKNLKVYKDVYGFEVYTLIGPLTFSSGTLAALDSKYYLDAIFVGEETGGNNLAYGNFDYITLPNTQDTVAISTQNYNLGMGGYHGLFPDIEVIQSFEGEVLGNDEAFELIRRDSK